MVGDSVFVWQETSQIWLQNEAADQWTGTIESTPSNASSTLLVGIDRSGIMRLEGVQRFVEIIKSKVGAACSVGWCCM